MKIYCYGDECPVKNTCLRYTEGFSSVDNKMFLRKCTNQKRYVQDTSAINKDSMKYINKTAL